ncbi:MAG: RIP metalloprotease RseP [Alphaproteobacteria bacterium]
MLNFVTYVVPFLVVLTVLVFVHEMGHYLVARWCKVRVETFSIGFGREIFGWHDKAGTRWKVSWLPLGGYVKFFGDLNATSAPDGKMLDSLTPAQREVAFHHKKLWQRTAIVAAGPFANFIYAIVILATMFVFYGQRVTPPEIGRVLSDGAGAAAGLQVGDVVESVEGRTVYRFEQLEEAVLLNPGLPVDLEVRRDGRTIPLTITPAAVELDVGQGLRDYGTIGVYASNPAVVGLVQDDSPAARAGFRVNDIVVAADGQRIDNFERLQDIVVGGEGKPIALTVMRDGRRLDLEVVPEARDYENADGGSVTRWVIGIQRAERPLYRHGPTSALVASVQTSWNMLAQTIDYVGQMIVGHRGTEDLGGPLRIAQVSGQAAQVGVEQVVMLSILLSLNLGLINLFPIPMLDGGHLLFYAFEAVRGRPLTERMQEYALRFGLAMILTLTVFVTWNDLINLRVVEFISGLFS